MYICSERENLNENYLEKSNFWNFSTGQGQTRSLPRPKRKVKFKDDPPERPPPPAPERHTTSFQVKLIFIWTIYDLNRVRNF